MRLRQVTLRRFQQFIDETIDINPFVTVIVGRNDTGKTSFLQRFFDQHVYEGVIHGAARPQVPGHVGDLIAFSLLWDVSPGDYAIFPLAEAFGRTDVSSIEIEFQQCDSPGEQWVYRVNGSQIIAYETPVGGGHPDRRANLEPRLLFPRPYYISIGESDYLRPIFEARLYDLLPSAIEVLRIEDILSIDALLLRIAGIRANTRALGGRGVDEPWPPTNMPRSAMLVEEIERRLEIVADRITEKLRAWWTDPPELTFRIKIGGNAGAKSYQHRINSFGFTWEMTDRFGTPLHSTGLRWFLTFIIKLLYVEDQRKPFLLLFDEPAAPLHPSAQRMVTRLLNSLTQHHQIICSTHSPFLIDWNFPQRVRLFTRNYESQRTLVSNKPYRGGGRHELIWDPLRESIGVTMGDISVVDETSILVEGVSDQVLLANASTLLNTRGRPYLDLTKTSIVPYGEEPALSFIVAKARARRGKICVLADGGEQGRKVIRYCQRKKIPCISTDLFNHRPGADSDIEDVIGIEHYIRYVNRFYSDFPWFRALDPAEVKQTIRTESLGRFLTVYFQSRFGQNFSKIGVAILIVDEIESLPLEVLNRFEAIIGELVRLAD
jgi:hypothetical protein